VHSQCPTITCPSIFTLTNCQGGNTLAATSNYSANITSRWIGPGNIPIASVGTATSVVYINYPETYTVEFTDNSSNCVVTKTVQVGSAYWKPTFNLSVSNFNMLCTSSQITINLFNSSTFPPGGPLTYTLLGPGTSSATVPGTLSSMSSYTTNICGNYEPIIRDATNFCDASFRFSIACSTLNPLPLVVTGNNTVCSGSSVTYTSNGTNNVWSNGPTTSTMNVIPNANSTYTVFGNDANNCPSSGTVAVIVNTNCSDVWPGDANSDGLVDNLDVFEIGLAMSSTGPARVPGGNIYSGQFASNWTGTVSTGKNLCHADCDGNGIIDLNDTLAITNNFLIPHAFKTTSSNNPDLTITANPIVNAGLWNKATISLGDNSNPVSQISGIAFTVDYDASMIETDSIYIRYLSSFLNANGQNIEFRKKIFSANKFYGTSIRTDGINATGNGAIAEVYFKMKSGIPENTVFSLSLSNTQKINASGNLSVLTSGSSTMLVDANAVGISEQENKKVNVCFFPNPASDEITFLNNSTDILSYTLININGEELQNGKFNQQIKVNLQNYKSGTYFVRFDLNGVKAYKKLIITR